MTNDIPSLKVLPTPHSIKVTWPFAEKIETIRCKLYPLLTTKPTNPPASTPNFLLPLCPVRGRIYLPVETCPFSVALSPSLTSSGQHSRVGCHSCRHYPLLQVGRAGCRPGARPVGAPCTAPGCDAEPGSPGQGRCPGSLCWPCEQRHWALNQSRERRHLPSALPSSSTRLANSPESQQLGEARARRRAAQGMQASGSPFDCSCHRRSQHRSPPRASRRAAPTCRKQPPFPAPQIHGSQ